MTEECLVEKARKKCQCGWCKLIRTNNHFILQNYVQTEIMKRYMDVYLKEKSK